ncbi:unnamed protein product [Nezara viridula]|uniref:t-SNARE coiled-coil homology domain-containing protein n=1 Tax=Nezara viridula TaxID=85310 RepID=A0A9P0HIV2_NEZVI|nr:unnamed protein product [Nezara viridula]
MDDVDLSDFNYDYENENIGLGEKILENSFESTKRILMLCEESEEVGCKTAVMLQGQGEQLKTIEEGMERISGELRQSNKYISGLEKCCGLCLNPFRRRNKLQKVKSSLLNNSRKKTVIAQQPSSSKTVKKIDKKVRWMNISDSPLENKIEDNIYEVDTMIGNLKSLALNMSEEIENQNNSIDNIALKQTCNIDNIEMLKQRAEKINK